MGTTLTGLTPATTYDALLKTTDNQQLTTTRKVITDGTGNDSALSLATTSAGINGTLTVSSTLTASNFSGTSSNTNTGDETNATIKSKLGAATTSVDGYLTSTDWDTFNNKQNALTNPVTGRGNANFLTKFFGDSNIGNSLIFDNGTNVGIGTQIPSSKLTVAGSGSFSGALNVSGSSFFLGAVVANSSLNVGTSLDVNSRCQIGSLGDGEYRLYVDTGVVSIIADNFFVNNSTRTLQFNTSGLNFTGLSCNVSGLGTIGMNGALSGATTISMNGALSGARSISMGGALTGATDITGSGKLSIANIGASGTLNVGSTTTATKLLELTADNTGGVENNTLRFVNTDTTVLANEVIGKIEFFSNDASAPGASVKAYISAGATTTSPNGYLDFATDQLTGTPIVRQRIQADGKVLIGTTTPIASNNANLVQVNGGLDHNIIMRASSSGSLTLGFDIKGSFFETTAGGAVSVTIPTNAAVPFPVGTQIWFVQGGAGVPTFTGDTGVTLRTRSASRQPFARFSEVKLTKTNTDEWYLTGDLKA
jgi:hypothetical protein